MRRPVALLMLLLLPPAFGQVGGFEVRELERPVTYGDPILRQDWERCQPAAAIVRDERRPDTWLLRTRDWPSPLLNPMGNPPDLTYDPRLKGEYDIYLGTRATDFEVSVGLKLAGEAAFSIITSPRETHTLHRDWEFCFRRQAPLDGEKIIIHSLGVAAYVNYLKFVPIIRGTERRRVATDHVVIASQKGKHFAFPGVAKLRDGSLAAVFREGTAHVDPSGSIALCRSMDGGRTWSPRRTIYDDPRIDERDPGILQHSSGALVVSLNSDGPQVIRSLDGGQTWDKPTSAPVFSPHGPRELPDGRLYWCGICTEAGLNHVQVVTSRDLGRTWQPEATLAASLPFHQPWVSEFWDEPFALPLAGGGWLCLYRVDRDGYQWANRSGPQGRGATAPQRTAMWGCPPFVLRLGDGRLLAVYGYRRPPFGIRACVSRDQGLTWDTGDELVLRADGGGGDLGYPTALELEPGLVLAVYYFNHGGPECTIEGTFFRP